MTIILATLASGALILAGWFLTLVSCVIALAVANVMPICEPPDDRTHALMHVSAATGFAGGFLCALAVVAAILHITR